MRVDAALSNSAVAKPKRQVMPRGLNRPCSVERTVEILSDAWMFLVLRECYFGSRRFEQFQSLLRLPRNTLVMRLNKLTALGLMKKVAYSNGTSRFEYRLTDRGMDLYPTMLSLLDFGDNWLCDQAVKPLQLIHKVCGKRCSPKVVCSHCQRSVFPNDVTYQDGLGAIKNVIASNRTRSRRASDPSVLERVRPCSVAKSLQIIGDRWSFLVIREMFFGTRRFDDFEKNLGIASNILTDRLQRLTAFGIAQKVRYQDKPERFEYRFTDKGRALYGPMIVMMRWGDRWLSDGGIAPLSLHHVSCGHDFSACVVCSHCNQELFARDMSFNLFYTL